MSSKLVGRLRRQVGKEQAGRAQAESEKEGWSKRKVRKRDGASRKFPQ